MQLYTASDGILLDIINLMQLQPYNITKWSS